MIFHLKQSMIHPVQQLASHDFLWIRLILADSRGITPVLGPQLHKFHGWGGLCGPRKRPSQFPRSQWDRGGRWQRSPNLHTPSGSHERRRHFIRRGVPFRVLSFGSMDACPLNIDFFSQLSRISTRRGQLTSTMFSILCDEMLPGLVSSMYNAL